MYERMKRLLSGETAQQHLLVPDILKVTPAQAEAAEAHEAEFAALGFALTRLAPDQLALRGGAEPAGGAMTRQTSCATCCRISAETGHSRRVEESINQLPRHHGLPCSGARPAYVQHRGNERPAARDGAHRSGRPVQSWPANLGAAVARGSRSAVHARALMPPAAQAQNSSGTKSERRSALLLMGPTGAGKSELALDLARRFPFEIVSVDSAQVYRGMDIGTAKPELETRARVIHHLIDIREPETAIPRVSSRAMPARRCARSGAAAGSRCWSAAPCCISTRCSVGSPGCPRRTPRCVREIDARAAAGGWAALHEELRRVDPAAAARIHVNDPQRIQRALEVYRVTGEPITRLQQSAAPAFAEIELLEFAISPEERAVLHARIAQRFEAMWRTGLLDEVRVLHQRPMLSAEHPAMRAVGYRQLWKFLSGHSSLEDAKKQALAATRQLAKRQLTWLRRRERATWVDSAQTDPTLQIVHALSEGGFAGWSYA